MLTPPTSLACMLIVWQMTTLPSATIRLISASGTPRGSLSLRFICRNSSSLAWLAGEVMMTSRNGLPISVGPMLTTLSLPPLSFSSSL